MLTRRFNKISSFLLGTFLVWGFNVTFAYDCRSYASDMRSGQTPNLRQLVCPIVGLINIALGIVAGVFIVVVVYAAIKASMALGDPKAIKGAQQAWLYAGIGLGVILLSLSLIYIVTSIFGIDIGGPMQWADLLWNALINIETFGEP